VVSRVLVTTANEQTWPKDEPILFLGEWCRRYRRKESWKDLDYVVARPFLASQQECDEIYPYIKDSVERLLPVIANSLNSIHGTEFSIRFWRIVLGHWLVRYTSVMYNRWFSLRQALLENDISKVASLDYSNYTVATKDSWEFAWASNDEIWNGAVDRMALATFESVPPIVEFSACDELMFRFETPILQEIKNTKSNLWKMTRSTLKMFQRDTDAVFVETYLPIKQDLLLQLRLGQFPQFHTKWEFESAENYSPLMRHRQSAIYEQKLDDQFFDWLALSFMEFLPISLVEDFATSRLTAKRLELPRRPKLIFTSNRFDYDEVFKIWAGEKVESGSRYITGQHGNNIGTRKNYFTEDECVAISDRFITWGWTDGSLKHIPAFNFKTNGVEPPKLCETGGLLLIDLSIEHRNWPWDTDVEIGVHQNDQFRFVGSLPQEIRKATMVRLWPSQRRLPWGDEERWRDWDPSLRVSVDDQSLSSLIGASRLVVHSYDSTGILEFLSWNIPCLAFWTRGLDHLRDSARPYYELLVDAGVIHLTAESCAKHVTTVWDRVENWWCETDVQNARQVFCDRYAQTTRTPVRDIYKTLRS